MNETEKIVMTPAEEAFITRFTAEKCRSHAEVMAERLANFVMKRQMALLEEDSAFALAAAPQPDAQHESVRTPQAVSPNEQVTFTFASDAEDAWRAVLSVPPKAVADTMLSIDVTDAHGQKVESGMLTLSGCRLPLVAGHAEIPFGLFLNGIQDTDVSLRRAPNTPAVPGKLTFF